MRTKSTGNKASYTRHSTEYKQESLNWPLKLQLSDWVYMNPSSIPGVNNLSTPTQLVID